ncbi:hypothetical protein Sarmat_00166 [Rickettsiales endosymbiont of Paramecium tredecaurelia]|uniref:DUF4401 domain-containing protein n=1 Tax=Candidatus Sarmatiella mevalonica TaxID=2770581 RepID=UPI0019221FF9|nr:DUF4401 domain-containing protein [Candidatus Sarmatiella mevalonica]MBL3284326.1 hypothetical protein [Candidatus Sarmatiella mevalonica]
MESKRKKYAKHRAANIRPICEDSSIATMSVVVAKVELQKKSNAEFNGRCSVGLREELLSAFLVVFICIGAFIAFFSGLNILPVISSQPINVQFAVGILGIIVSIFLYIRFENKTGFAYYFYNILSFSCVMLSRFVLFGVVREAKIDAPFLWTMVTLALISITYPFYRIFIDRFLSVCFVLCTFVQDAHNLCNYSSFQSCVLCQSRASIFPITDILFSCAFCVQFGCVMLFMLYYSTRPAQYTPMYTPIIHAFAAFLCVALALFGSGLEKARVVYSTFYLTTNIVTPMGFVCFLIYGRKYLIRHPSKLIHDEQMQGAELPAYIELSDGFESAATHTSPSGVEFGKKAIHLERWLCALLCVCSLLIGYLGASGALLALMFVIFSYAQKHYIAYIISSILFFAFAIMYYYTADMEPVIRSWLMIASGLVMLFVALLSERSAGQLRSN